MDITALVTLFKSGTNRAPRQKSNGTPDIRNLKLELMLLADVGLLGHLTPENQPLFVRFQPKPKLQITPLLLWYPI